jgi:hypothetical protein
VIAGYHERAAAAAAAAAPPCFTAAYEVIAPAR